MESLKGSLLEREEKNVKMVKTLKAARTRIDALKGERDQVHLYPPFSPSLSLCV